MKSTIGLILAVCLLSPAPAGAATCDGVSPVDATSLVSVVVESGLTGRPLLVTAAPDDPDRIFIVEQDGFIWVKQRGSAPGVRSLYLDVSGAVTISNNEQGLLGMAFTPDFATSGLFYISYTRPGGTAGISVVARYQQDPMNPNQALPMSQGNFFSLAQPQGNHNGGNIEVDSNGLLYLGLGDGGNGNDVGSGHSTCGNGQDATNLLGTIIRIDPTATAPNARECGLGTYTIPDGNPLADGVGGACDEIWATGLRNPWRFTFDTNGDLYIADVGQECWEEINWVPGSSAGGENYGWRSMEGGHCFDPANAFNCNSTPVVCTGATGCNDPSLTDPVWEVQQTGFTCSITGGYVYRGCRMPNMLGHYFWGDFCDGQVRSFLMSGGVPTLETNWTTTVDPGGTLLFDLTSFGRDARGELYLVDRDGVILKMVPPLSDFEVSGTGVLDTDTFLLTDSGNWTWEDLQFNSAHPIDYYSVYRGTPGGVFDCIHATAATSWSGDAATPVPGQVYGYLVTATNVAGIETSPGSGRLLGATCPAPPIR
jgi:glucose/arabinose dehydrogenase